MLASKKVAISILKTPAAYPIFPPFNPGEEYPELKGRVEPGVEKNITYRLFRQVMRELWMDIDRFSKPNWNPLGELIQPGQKVIIKPNLVRHSHLGEGDYQAVVTHGSLVRCVLDYVAIALQGKGEITVGDAPVQSGDFSKTVDQTGLIEVCDDVSKTWSIPIRLLDFRLRSMSVDERQCVVEEAVLEGDPAGYMSVNLGKGSLLSPLGDQYERYRVTNYDCTEMRKHHNKTINEYLIPQTVLDADVVINLPKLKTHRKVCLTAALKNLVGINGQKDWLPHHRCGSLKEGGDEYRYPSVLKKFNTKLIQKIDRNPFSKLNWSRRLAIRIATRLSRSVSRDSFEEGSWYGNDTLWRTVLDLNRLLVYADKNGNMTDIPQRKTLTIVDGIIAGEGEGPMEPDARSCGLLIGGVNPVAVDAVLATLIGFDYSKIPLISKGFEIDDWPLSQFRPGNIEVRSENSRWRLLKVGDSCEDFCFSAPSGWSGHVEVQCCKGRTMNNKKSENVESTLKAEDVHLEWEESYRTKWNERFYEEAFDYIIKVLNPPKGSTFLDVGCGPCAHSMRLARRGFYVQATDFSESVLKMAESQVRSSGLQDKIKLQRENILSFSFKDQSFDYILCWGVLMHIPDIEKAILEISRILKRGGTLIISEGNMNSLESGTVRLLKELLGKKKAIVRKTPAGLEYWEQTTAGELVTRQANVPWLIKAFETNGLTVKRRVPGQFTEIYTMFSSSLMKNLIHSFNRFWFKYVKIPYFSFGNIITLQKDK